MKTKVVKIAMVGFILINSFIGITAQNLSVFVSPHQDDWQLFMNPNAYNQVAKSGQKVVFLHITAGDGGFNDAPYIEARNQGSLRAIRFLVSSTSYVREMNMNPSVVNINGHPIQKYTYGNAVAYFIKLPDGNLTGEGHAINNFESLRKIKNGTIPTITTIDGSTTYNSINDLLTTLKQIIISESTPAGTIDIHCADTSMDENAGDHPDHYASSEIFQQIAATFDKVNMYFYREYIIESLPQNLFGKDLLIEAATWGVTNLGLTDYNAVSTFDNLHNSWLGRQYFRVVEITNTGPVVVADTIAPTAPTNLTATAASSSTINLSWSAATDNVAVTGYTIYRDNVLITNTPTLEYTDISLQPGTTYTYTVTANDSTGNVSPFSNTASATTPLLTDVEAPTTPTGLTVTNVTFNSVSISWTASTDNVAVTGYAVYRNSTFIANTTELTYTESGLTTGTNYTYTVRAFDAEGNQSSHSEAVTTTTLTDSSAPSIPSNVSALTGSTTSINVSWSASTDNVAVTGYAVYRNNVFLANTNLLSYTDNTLLPGTTYTYTIKAFDAAGNQSDFSLSASATTSVQSPNLALNKPATASSFEYNDASYANNGNYDRWDFWSGSPYVQWWRVDLQNEYLLNKVVVFTYYDGGRYYRYDIQVSLDGINWLPLVDFNNNTTPATAAGNSFDINHVKARYIRVNMNYNSANAGVHIIEFEAYGSLYVPTEIDTDAPSSPSNVAALANSSTSIDVSWSASTDNIAVTGYAIYRNNVFLANVAALNYTDNNLVSGTTYTYTIKAYDAAGNQSGFSSPASATTTVQSVNLALNKPATASGFEYNDASYANNGNYDQWDFWSANPYMQWWRVDLQNVYSLNKLVVITYYGGGRHYRYDIQVSVDGTNWTTAVDFNNNTIAATSAGNTFNISNVNARYIRVNMNYNSANSAVHIIEFEAYGTLYQENQVIVQPNKNSQELMSEYLAESLNNAVKSIESGDLLKSSSINENLVSVYPNPISQKDEISLVYKLPKAGEKVNVGIYSLSGKKIIGREFVSTVAGINEFRIKPNAPLYGTYLIVSDYNNKREKKKVIVE